MNRLSMQLSIINLLDCHEINSMHLCEEHGGLKKELSSTCLGSLYIQDFANTLVLCGIYIVAQAKMVL
jgi:hypothetical protein